MAARGCIILVRITVTFPRWARAYLELLAMLVETVGLEVDHDAVCDSIIAGTKFEVTS
jgi:hypothetical protein